MFVILFLETWGLSARMTAWVSLIILVIICSHRHCRPHNYRCLSALTQRSAQMPMSAVFMSALVSLPEISVISKPTSFHDDLIKNSDRDVWQAANPDSRNMDGWKSTASFLSFVRCWRHPAPLSMNENMIKNIDREQCKASRSSDSRNMPWTAERAQFLSFLLSDSDNILPLSQWTLQHRKRQRARHAK